MSEDAEVEKMVRDALTLEMGRPRTLEELAARVADACVNIESNQKAWIVGGIQMKPEPRMIEALADYQQIYNFLEACRCQPGKVIKRLSATMAPR